LLEEVTAKLREEPSEVLPHRLLSTSFVLTSRRPLVRALYTGDMEILGALAESALHQQQVEARAQAFDTLLRHGLLFDIPNLDFALAAATSGFYLVDDLSPEYRDLDTEAKAAALRHVVRHAFEPATDPDRETLAAAANELTSTFDGLIETYRRFVHAQDPAQQSS
jgi:hypothetical protein